MQGKEGWTGTDVREREREGWEQGRRKEGGNGKQTTCVY